MSARLAVRLAVATGVVLVAGEVHPVLVVPAATVADVVVRAVWGVARDACEARRVVAERMGRAS